MRKQAMPTTMPWQEIDLAPGELPAMDRIRRRAEWRGDNMLGRPRKTFNIVQAAPSNDTNRRLHGAEV